LVGYLALAAALVVMLVALALFAFDGFRNGDFTGEALARALHRDLAEAARRWDREAK